MEARAQHAVGHHASPTLLRTLPEARQHVGSAEPLAGMNRTLFQPLNEPM